METHIMVDIETLGTGVNAPILQLAAVDFDIYSGNILRKFNMFVDICTISHFVPDTKTVKWWLKTNSQLLAEIINNENIADSEKVLSLFAVWSNPFDNKNVYLWGNGENFDNVIIRQAYINSGLIYPIKYNCDRDVRTILHIASDVLGISEQEIKNKFIDECKMQHDALQDAIFQAKYVSWCYRELSKNSKRKGL
jgi:hypothetical protein